MKPIGTDIYYKEIFPGDTIKDASGKYYTVTSGGSIKPLDGGNELTLSNIDEPQICDAVQAKQTTQAPEVRPVKIMERKGKENKSGLVSLGNLARKLHTKQAGFARTLRAAGIEVVKGKNGYAIRVADVKKAEEILAPLSVVPQEGRKPAKIKREAPKRPKLTDASGALLPGVTISHDGLGEEHVTIEHPQVPLSDRCPAVDFEALKEQEAEAAVRGILAQFEDQALADELRRRGYELTATKTITVTL